jgi:enamine deaminase RidA (YjgF/YER057c/UK114 family)
MNVYLNAEEGFTAHAKIADFASELLIEKLGAGCIGSRAAIGVASLPSNASVEISMIAKVV